jgi:hypothetical protein
VIRGARARTLALAIVAVAPHVVRAQQPASPGVAPEVRADLIFGDRPAVQAGAGVQIPFGYYVRVGIDGAVGARTGRRLSSQGTVDGRLDVLARFLLDPFRQSAYGLSLGGGMSLRAEPGERAKPWLLVAVELEGRRSARGLAPAVQLGLGGGVRVGVVLRRAAVGAR